MSKDRRPLPPVAAGLFTFVLVPVAVTLAGYFTRTSMEALTIGIQGGFKLGVVLGVIAFFLARQRGRAWEERQRAAKLEENRKANAGRPRCRRCGIAITGAEQAWQQESFCSAKCQALGVKA